MLLSQLNSNSVSSRVEDRKKRFTAGAAAGCLALAVLLRDSMIDVALSILALIAGGLTLELFAATGPPLGHPEERAYNFRSKTLEAIEELQIGNPS